MSNVYSHLIIYKKRQTMKTAKRILMTFAILVFFAGMTFSQSASTTVPAKDAAKQDLTAAPGKLVDNDKNGTCAKHDAKGTCSQGKNFVDKNGDGKCDNCGGTGKCDGTNCGKGQKCGSGCGQGQGKGNGCGQGQKQGSGCTKPCGNAPAAQPNK
jgi:hypothetical protein